MAIDEEVGTEKGFLFKPPAPDGSAPAYAEDHQEGPQDNPAPPHEAPSFDQDVITIGKTKYAVGLFWQPLQDVDDPIPEIRETIEEDSGSDLYCIHYGRTPQYGVGKKSKGHKEGQTVAAIALLDALSDKSSFVAVFHVDEGWWFVAVRNDLVLPEEDILYRTEEEAKDAFFSMMAVPDWGYKIAPASWHIDDTQEMQLVDLLKNTTQVRLVSLSAVRGTKILLAIAVIILLVVGVIVYLVMGLLGQTQQAPASIEPVKPQATIQTIEPTREDEKPWEKLVDIPPFLQRCTSYAYQMKSMTVPGWGLNRVICTPTGIATGWSMTWPRGGRLAWLVAAYNEYNMKSVEMNLAESGTSATASISYNDLSIVASTPTLSLARIRREMTDISQALVMPIAMSNQQVTIGGPPPGQEPPADASQQPIGRTYKYLSFSFSSSMDPLAWQNFFDKFTAIEIIKIEYNPRSDSALSANWSYEGRIYEK